MFTAREVVFCGVVCFASVLTCCSSLYSGESCHQQGGTQGGICTPLRRCPQYQNIIHNSHGLSKELAHQLRVLGCGYEGRNPLICCKRPRQPIIRTNTMDGTSDPRVGHRNLRLLPTNCGVSTDDDRIINGVTTNLAQFPWMVQLLYKKSNIVTEHKCGGSLINERYVLTAAHCILYNDFWTLHEVVLGDIRREPKCNATECYSTEKMQIQRKDVQIHEDFSENDVQKKNDIALIRLPQRVNLKLYDTIKPICLPTTVELQNQNLTGVCATVAGWGLTDPDTETPATVLQHAYLPVISTEQCKETFYFHHIDDKKLCTKEIVGPTEECAGAGNERNKKDVHVNACKGDSGGPLVYTDKVSASSTPTVRQVQWGIVSHSTARCAVNKPAIYTRVVSYMNWILDHIEE